MSITQDRPTIGIYPDFGGYTHSIDYPKDYSQNPAKYPSEAELIPSRFHALLNDWQREFQKCANEEIYDRIPGAMLWVSFDLKGLKIARLIKKHVGDKARVIYQKPIECPYWRYDTNREVMENGELVALDWDIGWHNL